MMTYQRHNQHPGSSRRLRLAAAMAAGIALLAGTLLVATPFATAPGLAQELAARYILPSGSMKPTLLPQTTLSAFKYPSGAAPARGDIIAFRLTSNPQTVFLMRVVGLPGERIQMVDGVLQINGEPVKREQMPDFADTEDGKTIQVKRWRETLPNGVSYTTLELPYNKQSDNTEVYEVPADNYFMMGDNRHNSTDSRFPQVGFVPFENFVGRAQLIFFSVHEGERAWEIWRWPFSVRWSRLFTIVR
jgi:signal peptidase I